MYYIIDYILFLYQLSMRDLTIVFFYCHHDFVKS